MPEELEFNGIGAESEDDVSQGVREQLSTAVLWATDWTVETIINQLKRGNIQLNPRFQRREAWDFRKKSRFVESLILGFPVPQLVLAERREKKGAYLVIDGKQRLLSLRRFCAEPNDAEFESFDLQGLTIRQELNGHSYAELSDDDLTSFQNQTIRTTVIRNWPNENFLYTVFHRLNTGSVPLSPQELRQALHPGPFLAFADEFASGSAAIRRLLRKQEPDFRMRDVELLIRFLAFRRFLPTYDGNLKKFLDETCFTLNSHWVVDEASIRNDALKLEQAIDLTFTVFGEENAFRKYFGSAFESRFNRAVFDIMVFYFSRLSTVAVTAQATAIKLAFERLCETDDSFRKSIESTTKSIRETGTRLNRWGETLAGLLPSETFQIPRLFNDQILVG